MDGKNAAACPAAFSLNKGMNADNRPAAVANRSLAAGIPARQRSSGYPFHLGRLGGAAMEMESQRHLKPGSYQ